MRNKTIDSLKAIAIIAVVFYHMGILTYGFLGVDIFFVIAGYFTTKSLLKKESNVFLFIGNRIKRLFPTIIIAGLVCFVIGLIGMLPDDFENVSEQIIASNFFSENILSAITTKNYWDVVNDYKPLMHMWYIGILFEFYLFYAVVLKGLKKINQIGGGIAFLTIVSLICYILPITSASNKFYLLPFRFFEFGVGGLICFFCIRRENKHFFYGTVILLLTLILLNPLNIPTQLHLIAVVLLSGIIIMTYPEKGNIVGNSVLAAIGKRSFSIFVWHQVFLAFYRYFFSNKITVLFSVWYLVAIAGITEISFRLIEKKLGGLSYKSAFAFSGALFLISCVASCYVFFHAGVVRDVPELDIYKNSVHRGMHAEYCDRVYRYDHEFLENGMPKVLIVGNSFARDWGNILLESGIPLDISYSYSINEKIIPRIKAADYIYYRKLYEELPKYAFDTKAKIYGISTKNFGESNGIIYKNRNKDDYYQQIVEVDAAVMSEYYEQKEKWGNEKFVDMIKPVEVSDGVVRVFTDDNKFISQDCRHLTKAGAQYYSRLLDLKTMFEME